MPKTPVSPEVIALARGAAIDHARVIEARAWAHRYGRELPIEAEAELAEILWGA